MALVSKSFTAVGVGLPVLVKHKQKFDYSVSGTFVATLYLEKSQDGGASWVRLLTTTAAASGTLLMENKDQGDALVRFQCKAFTSGTAVTTVESVAVGTIKRLVQVGAKVGATAGWVVNAADNKNSLARCPATQTASTLVVPISGLKVGDLITGVHLVGQIESAGGSVSVDMALRKQSAAAADLVDASVGSITQLVVTADTIMSSANTAVNSLVDDMGEDETFYVLITATTAGSTDIDLQAVAVTIKEA